MNLDQAKTMISGVVKVIDEKITPRDRESRKLLVACAEYLEEAVKLLDDPYGGQENAEVTDDSSNK